MKTDENVKKRILDCIEQNPRFSIEDCLNYLNENNLVSRSTVSHWLEKENYVQAWVKVENSVKLEKNTSRNQKLDNSEKSSEQSEKSSEQSEKFKIILETLQEEILNLKKDVINLKKDLLENDLKQVNEKDQLKKNFDDVFKEFKEELEVHQLKNKNYSYYLQSIEREKLIDPSFQVRNVVFSVRIPSHISHRLDIFCSKFSKQKGVLIAELIERFLCEENFYLTEEEQN